MGSSDERAETSGTYLLLVLIMYGERGQRTGPFALAPPLAVGKRYLGQVPFGYASSSGW